MEFINGNIFAVYATSPDLLYLFEIACLDGSSSPDTIKLLHTVKISYHQRSEIRSFSGMSRLVMLTSDKELKGLVIPHDKSVPPKIVELGRCKSDWDPQHCCVLGISASLFFDEENNTCAIVTHGWDSTPSSVQNYPVQSLLPHLRGMETAFDQDIGRLVFPWEHELFLVDLI